jgi:hypothetical protein
MDTIKIIIISHVYPFLAFIYGLKFILKFKKWKFLKSCILSIDDLFRNHIP